VSGDDAAKRKRRVNRCPKLIGVVMDSSIRRGGNGADAGADFAVDDPTRRWVIGIALAAVVGAAYFVVARLSVGLVLEPEGVAVFWPAAGITSGSLIAMGPRAWWPLAAGVIGASIAVHYDEPLWAGIALGVCNAGEALIVAGLVERYFYAHFRLDRLSQVLGLVLAAIAATALSGIGGAVTYRLLHGSSAALLITWQHWFASDVVGILAVAPLVVGLTVALRLRPPRSELIEGIAALFALTAVTVLIIFLPQESWETMLPITWLLPILVWLAARSRPVFSAAAAFIASSSIVFTTIFGIGHFGDASLSMTNRILEAQACILFVALGANALAALFAERRQSEASLIQSNLLLERERDNKLMNLEAVTASIAHEVKQPLAAIVTNGMAALRWLGRTPPDHDEVRAALNRMVDDGHRASEVIDGIRALFRRGHQGRQQIDVNEIVRGVVQTVESELKDRGVENRSELADLPLIDGHPGQLREVVLNLVQNAIEAMDSTKERSRILRVRTELLGRDAIAVAVEDSGPGIDPKRLDDIFGAFVTTKPHGMGLGLAICRMIIEHHGGELTASSDGKSGASFRFILPITPS
jgi:signal transduction histidine kinase